MRTRSRQPVFWLSVLWWALIGGFMLPTQAAPVDKPLVLAGEESAARPGDADALQKLAAAQETSAWLVTVNKSWYVKPPLLGAAIYLNPDTVTSRLRRGKFLQASAPDNAEGHWELLPGRATEPPLYAQVSLADQPFREKPEMPDRLDCPFRVLGEIPDADVIALVNYIRTGPSDWQVRPATASEKLGDEEVVGVVTGSGTVDGKNPVSLMERTGPKTISITTEQQRESGQILDLQKVDGHWKIQKICMWVA